MGLATTACMGSRFHQADGIHLVLKCLPKSTFTQNPGIMSRSRPPCNIVSDLLFCIKHDLHIDAIEVFSVDIHFLFLFGSNNSYVSPINYCTHTTPGNPAIVENSPCNSRISSGFTGKFINLASMCSAVRSSRV